MINEPESENTENTSNSFLPLLKGLFLLVMIIALCVFVLGVSILPWVYIFTILF